MGTHGRDSALCTVLLVFALVAAVRPQTPFPYQDLGADLAARIASVIPAGTQIVSMAPAPDNESDDIALLIADMSARLAARGVTVGPPTEGAPAIRLSCLQNLRDRSCAADIRVGTASDLVMVTRADESRSRGDASASMSIDLRLLFSQRTQILDVAMAGERLLVLDVESLSLYQRTAGAAWQRLESRPITTGRAWPRDPRGRLRLESGRVDVWLPGITCTGSMAPLTITCAARQQAWPLDIDNGGLQAGRNYFTTSEGLTFYSAALLADASGARWLVASRDGTLTWLDAGRRAAGDAGSGGDVTGLAAACGPGPLVVAVDHVPGVESDALRIFQALRRRLVPAASAVALAGTATALWSTPGADTATVIVQDGRATRYEAFQISIACGR